MEEQTLGEKRIRTKFNPGSNDTVQQLKELAAQMIDLLEMLRTVGGDKDQRLISTAQTSVEEAAMWAVKAATS